MYKKIIKDWENFSKTLEADFISPGYGANDEVKKWLTSSLRKVEQSTIERCLKALPGENHEDFGYIGNDRDKWYRAGIKEGNNFYRQKSISAIKKEFNKE